MAKKRSKSAKIKAQAHRANGAQKPKVFAPTAKETPAQPSFSQSANKISKPLIQDPTFFNQLIGYNVSLIYRDLFKSLMITVLFIAVLVAVFLYT